MAASYPRGPGSFTRGCTRSVKRSRTRRTPRRRRGAPAGVALRAGPVPGPVRPFPHPVVGRPALDRVCGRPPSSLGSGAVRARRAAPAHASRPRRRGRRRRVGPRAVPPGTGGAVGGRRAGWPRRRAGRRIGRLVDRPHGGVRLRQSPAGVRIDRAGLRSALSLARPGLRSGRLAGGPHGGRGRSGAHPAAAANPARRQAGAGHLRGCSGHRPRARPRGVRDLRRSTAVRGAVLPRPGPGTARRAARRRPRLRSDLTAVRCRPPGRLARAVAQVA